MSTFVFYDRQRRTQTKASVFKVLAWIMIVFNLAGALVGVHIWLEMTAIANGVWYSEDQLAMYDDINGELGVGQFGISLLLMISFLVWKYSAYQLTLSYRALGRNYTPAKAAFMYLVPLLSLYVPYEVMVELYQISAFLANPRDPEHDYLVAWSHQTVPQLILLWWIVFLIGQFLDKILVRVYSKDIETIESYLNYLTVMTISDIFGVVSVGLMLAVVIRVSTLQKRMILTEDEAAEGNQGDSSQ